MSPPFLSCFGDSIGPPSKADVRPVRDDSSSSYWSLLICVVPTVLLVLLGLLVACSPGRRGGSSGSSGDDDDDDDFVGQEIAVVMETDYGVVGLDLYPEAAPVTVDNFLDYVDIGFYDGGDGLGPTLFHRVLDGFVAQGGGYTEDGVLKDTSAPS